MNKEIEALFEQIAEDAVTEADEIECTNQERTEGLRIIRKRVDERFEESKDHRED